MLNAFAFAFVMSFVGSLPPGPGNLAVLHTVLNRNVKAGLWVALGASIPEIPYSYLAVLAVEYISAFQSFNLILELITMAVLLIMGIYTLFFQSEKKTDLDKKGQIEKSRFHPFWKGFIIAVFNPMLVAFWLITSKMADNMGWLDPHKMADKIAFVIGTSLGAGVLLVCVAFFTRKIRDRVTEKSLSLVNKCIGLVFLGLFIIHSAELYFKYYSK